MKLHLLDTEFDYPNDVTSLQKIADEINLKTEETPYFFSHFVIDGIEVYEEYQEYLAEHIKKIELIEVYLKTKKEFINELTLSLENYLTRAIPEIQLLSEEYYQIAKSSTWEKFQEMLDGIEWINGTIVSIDHEEEKPKSWNEVLKLGSDLQEVLKQLTDGMASKDEILIGDILQYEFITLLEELKNKIIMIIDTEGKRDLLN
ncbi:hypothetical protein [Alkalicoccobacillus murimartini]|uniref:Phage infection (PIP) family protein YhgE n=1 Tax=Alkalicoccobacillus murimartini TaxID=171685 RepID=A0ABT9YIA1_9BACI|nr:hypothetical protein [Alkalicoccobacillus murimartini]MDQ0206937.1 putative phage infection (PIP) family protein YhgE [Alkalicoccobacillus murimartini]